MSIRSFYLTLCLSLFSPAVAQEVTSRPLPASAEVSPYQNSTTKFRNVEFTITQLINTPNDRTGYRLVAQLTNTGRSDMWVQYLAPQPEIIDDMGNTYLLDRSYGIEACREHSGGGWTSYISRCTVGFNANLSTRLAPGVPVTTVLEFRPTEATSGFDDNLAELATSITLTLRLALSADEFSSEDSIDAHKSIVPNIPIPGR